MTRVPQTLIDTPRLAMRHFCLEDASAVYQFSSDSRVTRYTGDAGIVTCEQTTGKVITDIWLADYQMYGYGRMALIHKADNKLIGFCGVKYLVSENMAGLGYRMLPEYWGQGLGLEAASAILNYAKSSLKLEQIMADVHPDNHGSRRILEKLGFDYVETRHNAGEPQLIFLWQSCGQG